MPPMVNAHLVHEHADLESEFGILTESGTPQLLAGLLFACCSHVPEPDICNIQCPWVHAKVSTMTFPA